MLRGTGFQTWEYSPEYGLRSWFYILVHGLPATIHLPFMSGPMLFFFIRMMLALFCTFSQLWLCESIQVVFGGNVANLWMWLTVVTTGNFISSTAFLPSTTCMYLTCIWMGFWLRNKYNWAVYTVAFSAMFSWPFSVALGIPLAIDCIGRKRKFSTFLYYCVESFVIINIVQGLWSLSGHRLLNFRLDKYNFQACLTGIFMEPQSSRGSIFWRITFCRTRDPICTARSRFRFTWRIWQLISGRSGFLGCYRSRFVALRNMPFQLRSNTISRCIRWPCGTWRPCTAGWRYSSFSRIKRNAFYFQCILFLS